MSVAVEYVFKRSGEFTPVEKQQWLELFSTVFGKRRSLVDFDRLFLQTPTGYSYHVLMLRDGQVGGAFNAVPYRYHYFGREHLLALSVDTMINPDFRDNPFHMKKMAQLCHQRMAVDGIPAIIGFPNRNYYEYEKRAIRSRDIGRLDFYVLPLKGGNVFRRWKRTLNLLWAPVAWLMLKRGSETRRGREYPIRKIDDEQFRQQRYTSDHRFLSLAGGAECVCRSYVEKNGSVASYLIDVIPMNPANFSLAVKAVCQAFPNADIVIYVGKLEFQPCNLFRLPWRFHPQEINMTGKLLQEGVLDERFFAMGNWQINIANFDVR